MRYRNDWETQNNLYNRLEVWSSNQTIGRLVFCCCDKMPKRNKLEKEKLIFFTGPEVLVHCYLNPMFGVEFC
jgi:hypothetical protein